MFNPNKKFWKDYNQIFKRDPAEANLFLLLCELADEKGQVEIDDEQLTLLANIRFPDSTRHQRKDGGVYA